LFPVLAFAALPAQAQDLQGLQREMQEMRRQYDAQLEQMRRDYEQRLQDVEQRMKQAETGTATAVKPATQAPTSASVKPGTGAGNNVFNPAIGVTLDGRFGMFSQNPSTYRIPGAQLGEEANPGPRGFALGETEINLSANVDHWLFGNLTVAVERQGEVSLEEAFLQTTALPWGFTARAGRFFSGVGYLNEQHAHTWNFADQALPYRAFLNNHYDDDGVQLRWLAPTPFFLEFGAEVFRGDAFPAGGGSRAVGTYAAFVHVGDDFDESSSWRMGVSHLRGKARDRVTGDGADVFRGRSNLTILDAVYKWAPQGNAAERSLKLQGEFMFRREGGQFNTLDYAGDAWGWYLQGVYKIAPRWDVGLRYDMVRAANSGLDLAGTTLDTLGTSARRYSAEMSYYTSEVGRFRLQYNLDQSRPRSDHELFLQYTVNIGAHGAHAY
jgi:hypothetical protein